MASRQKPVQCRCGKWHMGIDDGTFAALLRRNRVAAGLTQEALAERSGISTRAISDLERGLKTRPYRHTVHELAHALELSPADQMLFETAVTRKGKPRPSPLSPRPPRCIPVPPTAILGREREMDLLHQFRHADKRLITLTGTGGVGKTRLALDAAQPAVREYADGAVFVSLASLTDPALVPSTIAAAFGIRSTGSTSPELSLLTFLAEREVLMVLDNFEQVLPAGPFVSRLLAGSPRLNVLVTSRVPLRLRGEQELDLRPLAVPPQGRLPSPEEVAGIAAVALFVQRAQAVQPGFALTTENTAMVTEICRRLDGLPLALELAATRIKFLPPPALLARLSSRLDLLTEGAADAPARQQTLRSTFDWSYSLLGEEDQTLFAQLSVFTAGCTLGAAKAVCTGSSESWSGVLSGPASLVEKSLLCAEGTEEARFVMLETVREYAFERLQQSGMVQALKRRHFQYYLALAEQLPAKAEESGQAAWLGKVEVEHDNLRAALQWAHESGNEELGLRLAIALVRFWAMRGPLSEGRRWLSEFLAHGTGMPSALRAAALYTAAQLASQQQSGEAAVLFEECLALYRGLGDTPRCAEAALGLALEILHRGDRKQAEHLLEECVTLGQELGDKDLLATSLHFLAAGQSDAARSRVFAGRSKALYRASQDGRYKTDVPFAPGITPDGEGNEPPSLAASLKPLPMFGAFQRDYALGLAFGARNWGDYPFAIRVLETVLTQALEAGDRRFAAYPSAALGLIAREHGDYAGATARYQEVLAVFQEVEDTWGIGSALMGLSDVARDQGDVRRVIEFAEHSLVLFRQVGDPWFTGYALHNLGIAARYQGDWARSEAHFVESLTVFRKLRGDGPIAEVLASIGLLALEQRDDQRAEQAFTESLRIAENLGVRWLLGTLLEGMAGVARNLERAERAARLFGTAEALRTAIGTPMWPANRSIYARHVESVRAALGREKYLVTWQDGLARSAEEAIAYALE